MPTLRILHLALDVAVYLALAVLALRALHDWRVRRRKYHAATYTLSTYARRTTRRDPLPMRLRR